VRFALLGFVASIAGQFSPAPTADAMALPSPPVIHVTEVGGSVVASATTVRAGRVVVDFVRTQAEIMQLPSGASLHDARKDVYYVLNCAARCNPTVVRRVEREVRFTGGSTATNRTRIAETLSAGTYYLVNPFRLDLHAAALRVTGSPVARTWPRSIGTVTASATSLSVPRHMPQPGWMLVRNSSDRPCLFRMQYTLSGHSQADVDGTVGIGLVWPSRQLETYVDIPTAVGTIFCDWYANPFATEHWTRAYFPRTT
jgi:hypothetical protein